MIKKGWSWLWEDNVTTNADYWSSQILWVVVIGVGVSNFFN